MEKLETKRDRQPALLLALTACLLLLVSCGKNRVFERNQFLGNSWQWNEASSFEVEIKDTISAYDLFINIRHKDLYPYANIWLKVRTIYPNLDTVESRIEVPLAEPDGRWLGDCTGPLCFRRDLIGSSQRFPQAGTYRFEIQQDTRTNDLQGIRDIGIRIEKTMGLPE